MKPIIKVFCWLSLSAIVLTEGAEHNLSKNADSKVCYKGLGCFSTGGDFYSLTKRPYNSLPDSPKTINTQFILHTRSHDTEFLKYGDSESILNSKFDSTKKTKFIIHGFLDNGMKEWVVHMARELLTYEEFNVIAVNWGDGSGVPYFQATANTRVAGAVVAQFIMYLKAEFSLDYKNVHIIGHSLGAHVAGYAGERINKIPRITGLDPAEPYYDGMPRSVRLDTTDASFVDIIHTDDSSIIGIGFGTKQLSGHIDFFPNDGDDQPGCSAEGKVISYVVKGLKQGIRKTFACDHLRSLALFSDSINTKCPFYGFQCKTWSDFTKGRCGSCGPNGTECAQMGFHAIRYTEVKTTPSTVPFFLKTTAQVPFCLYNYQIVLHLFKHPKSDKQQGYLFLTITGSKGSIKKTKLSSELIKMTHPGTYYFLLTNTEDVGEIKSIDFEWEYESTLTSPSTWKIKKRLFGSGIKLYIENIKVNEMDITDPGLKRAVPSVFCGNKDDPVEELKPVTFYPQSYC